MTKTEKTLLRILACLYAPIFLLGAFMVSASILIRCAGLLLTMDTNLAKREFEPVKRAFKKIGI